MDQAIAPLLGPSKTALTEAEWATLNSRLAPYEAWHASKRGARVEKLGQSRIREILASPAQASLLELVAKDEALKVEAESLENVERLVRYYRDLYLLCTNFLSFPAPGASPAGLSPIANQRRKRHPASAGASWAKRFH